MTADERIEALLNRFGETIEDLPRPGLEGYSLAYDPDHRLCAFIYADIWVGLKCLDKIATMEDYICHLTDVIDRMENALMTATRIADCEYCENWEEKKRCSRNACCFQIDDISFHDEIVWEDDDEKKTATGAEGSE